MNSSVPITANGIIPIAQSDVANFPTIAFSIPDFEGEAILRIFANSTESEIACYSAVITNGNSFSQVPSVGTVLGIFTVIAALASFATAIYGEAVPTMRLHYAHSLSVGVVFAVWQHIFFTGALSVNWPSVLVAWWSNFAWSGGMIYSGTMQSSINHLIGNNVGNTSQVGAAPSGSTQESLGGGYDISLIYKRMFSSGIKRAANHPLGKDIARQIYKRAPGAVFKRDVVQRSVEQALQRRDTLVNSTNGYSWYGAPVGVGLPLPGNYSGFAGTLAQEGIRVSNAFMTGFLWFLILLVLLVAATMAFKWMLEGMARLKAIKQDRLAFFRQHWLGYSATVALRTCFLAWFMIMILVMFQFTYQSSGGVKAVAAIVFIVFLVGIPAIAAYACYYKMRIGNYESNPQRFQVERKKLLGKVPWLGMKKADPAGAAHDQMLPEGKSSSMPFWKRVSSHPSMTGSEGGMKSIHDDEDYIKKFGWLAGRFRRTRWWFFVFWLVYEFIRACFYGGASGHPLVQVFGLLVVEILAFTCIAWARPFEGRRLNLIVVYCLGFSKVASVALSAAFDVQFNLARITTTAIGIIIIVIQGILTIITMIAIIVGAISSYMSISRNHEDFRPRKWHGLREKYFDHLDRVVNDLPREPKPKKAKKDKKDKKSRADVVSSPEALKSGFEMKSIRRQAKIEDEDPDFTNEMAGDPAASYLSLDDRAPTPGGFDGSRSGAATPVRRSRAPSMQSVTNLPFGARPHRPSWSTKDFAGNQSTMQDAPERTFSPVDMSQSVADEEPIAATPRKHHSWTPSRTATLPNPKMRPTTSSTDLRLGGEESTLDTIGNVPAPVVRPRAGTGGSRLGNRSATPSYVQDDGIRNSGMSTEMFESNPGSKRGSRHPLTPAQEMEEWSLRGSQERRSAERRSQDDS